MTAKIISGLEVSASIREELKLRVARLVEHGKHPVLEVLLVGDDPASVSYVKGKEKAAGEVGIHENTIRLVEDTPESEIIKILDRLNHDPGIDGILVQVPLPHHINTEKILYHISPEKDVDGCHPANLGKLLRGQDCLRPCTPLGVQ